MEEEEGNTIQEGGAVPSNFIFLDDLLGSRERIPTGRRDGSKRDGYVFRSISGMAFVPGSTSTFFGAEGTGSFYVKTNVDSSPVYEIVVKSDGNRDTYRMRIEKVRYRDSDAISREEGKRIMYSILEREDAKIEKNNRDKWYVHDQGEEMTILEFLRELRQAVDRRLGLRRAGRQDDYGDRDYGRSDYGRRDDYGRDRRSDVEEKLRHSESDTDQALRVRKMLTDIRNTQPISHCVARGLQLLGTQVAGDNGKFHSAACESRFHLVSDATDSRGQDTDVTRDALPKPGEGIDKITGLGVLAQLFYDFVQIKSTSITRSKDPKDIASYVDFMRKMIKVFEGKDYTGSVEDLLKMNLSSVKDTASQKACATIKDDIDFRKGTSSGNNVIKVVRRLFGTQIQHAARCGQLLKQLFLIKKGDQDLIIRIHPNVMLKGFPELDRINRNARTILIDYYSKCEGLYKTGLQVLEVQQLQMVVQDQAQQKAHQQKAQQQKAQQQGRASRRVRFQTGSGFTATRKNRPIL
jgi:hypothetical protein